MDTQLPPWREAQWTHEEALAHAPLKADWVELGSVRHVFTHFALALDVWSATGAPKGDGEWRGPEVLPTVFGKAVKL